MSEDAFDAIIVGGGLAGCVAAYVLASQGADVLVIERGNYAGAKNMTGGRLYAHSLEKIMPDFAKRAPLERKVTKEKVSFLTDDTAVTLDYHNGRGQEPVEESYTLLRGTFDQWLAEQAEEAGAQFITGIRVEKILKEDGKVIGVEADGDSLLAKTVILAEGVNPLLGNSSAWLSPRCNPVPWRSEPRSLSPCQSSRYGIALMSAVMKALPGCLPVHPPMVSWVGASFTPIKTLFLWGLFVACTT